jgi:hypothetical protein
MTLFELNHLFKVPVSKCRVLGVRTTTYEFRGNKIQPITGAFSDILFEVQVGSWITYLKCIRSPKQTHPNTICSLIVERD